MSTLQMSASFKGINSSLKPSATRIINRDLSSANLLISEFVKLSNAADFTASFSGSGKDNGTGKGAATKIAEDMRTRISEPWRIAQANTSLCGPAVFFYLFGFNSPQLAAIIGG